MARRVLGGARKAAQAPAFDTGSGLALFTFLAAMHQLYGQYMRLHLAKKVRLCVPAQLQLPRQAQLPCSKKGINGQGHLPIAAAMLLFFGYNLVPTLAV